MVDNPHDAFFKLVFSQPEHAAGELRSVLPEALSVRIDWTTLALCPGSFIDEDLAQTHADLLFSARLDGSPALLYFLFEHLSTVQPLVPFRMLRYEVRIWDDWLSKHPAAKKLPPIVPLVLHHSEAGWHGAVQFEDLLDVSDEVFALLAPFVPRFRFVLDDISKTTDDALRRRAMSAMGTVALWCFRDVRKPGVLFQNLRLFRDLFAEIWSAPNGVAAVRAILRYILATTKKLDHEDIHGTVRRLFAPTGEGIMETLLDQMEELFMEKGIERGRREGMADGRREGIADSRRETLLRLLRRRFGALPESTLARVNAADIPVLDAWTDRVLTAHSLDEVWEATPPPAAE